MERQIPHVFSNMWNAKFLNTQNVKERLLGRDKKAGSNRG
jgi:hypothetical protein